MTASRTASTALDPERRRPRRPARRLLAGAIAALLAAAGLSAVGAVPAMAASASVAVSPATGIDPDNGTVTLTGSGFTPTGAGVNGVYAAVGPKAALDDAAWFFNAAYFQGAKWVSTIGADGGFTSTLTGLKKVFTSNGRTVDCASEECGVFTFAAHGSTDRTQDTYTPISFAAPAPASTSVALAADTSSVQEGGSITLTATVSPADAAGTVTFSEGSTELGSRPVSGGSAALTTAPAVGSHSITAAFAPSDAAAYAGSTSAPTTVTVTAAPQPAGPSVTLSPATGVAPVAGTVTVDGTGFSTTGPGFYVGVGPKSAKDNADWYVAASYYQGVKWATVDGKYGAKINADGTVSIALSGLKRVFTSNGASVDCGTVECGVFTFAAHGSTDRSQDTYTPIAFAAAAQTAVSVTSSTATAGHGAAVTFTATVAPAAAGTVEFFDDAASLGSAATAAGIASLTTSTLAVGAHAITAAFTPADATVAAPATSPATNVTVNAAGVPTVSVPEVPTGGGSITVTGSGFSTTAPGIYLGLGPAGLRGFYLDSAKLIPSETMWIAVGNPLVTTGTTRTAPMNADGSFSVTVTVPASTTATPTYALYTSKAHGQGFADPSQDTSTALTYAAPGAAITPSVAVSTSGGTGNAGDPVDVTVRVTPAAEGTITVLDNGKVVAEGLRLLPDVALPAARTASFAALASTSSSVTTRVPGLASGTHAFSAAFTPDDPSRFAPTVSPAVQFVVQPAAAVTPPAPAPVAAAQPTCVARAVSSATLDWGVKTSFRTYISGGIANGSWTLAGVSYADGRYGWTGGTGTFNPDETRGLVRYSGSVSFTGHDGVLNLVLSNLAIRVTSPTQATLIADVHSTDMSGKPSDYSGVSFATIALGGGGGGGAVSGSAFAVDGAATSLTADGAKAFAGFYNAGDALDPISFRFPLGAEVECDGTTTSGLASTGSTGSGSAPLLGGLLILAGIAAVAVVRRRTVRANAEAV